MMFSSTTVLMISRLESPPTDLAQGPGIEISKLNLDLELATCRMQPRAKSHRMSFATSHPTYSPPGLYKKTASSRDLTLAM